MDKQPINGAFTVNRSGGGCNRPPTVPRDLASEKKRHHG